MYLSSFTSPSTPAFARRRSPSAAFTLIELLAVIAIIGVLAAIIFSSIGAVRAHAAKTVELSAARQLMVGYHLYAGDHRGVLMAGRQSGVAAYNEAGGKVLMSEAAVRWPHRLRPYLGDRFKNVLYLGKQAELYDQLSSTSSGSMLDYMLSLSPSFGLNERFVGGEGAQRIQDTPIVRLSDTAAPSELITFVSAQNRGLGENSGNFYVHAPAYWAAGGTLSTQIAESEQDHVRGYVAFRHSAKAVVAYLDGHVSSVDVETLRDMRRWSEQARLSGAADYTPALAR